MDMEEDNHSLYAVSNPLAKSCDDLSSVDNLSIKDGKTGKVGDLDDKLEVNFSHQNNTLHQVVELDSDQCFQTTIRNYLPEIRLDPDTSFYTEVKKTPADQNDGKKEKYLSSELDKRHSTENLRDDIPKEYLYPSVDKKRSTENLTNNSPEEYSISEVQKQPSLVNHKINKEIHNDRMDSYAKETVELRNSSLTLEFNTAAKKLKTVQNRNTAPASSYDDLYAEVKKVPKLTKSTLSDKNPTLELYTAVNKIKTGQDRNSVRCMPASSDDDLYAEVKKVPKSTKPPLSDKNPSLEMATTVNKLKTGKNNNSDKYTSASSDDDLYAEVKKIPKSIKHPQLNRQNTYEELGEISLPLPPRNYLENGGIISSAVVNGENHQQRTEVINVKPNQFSACFLGSMPLEDKDLLKEKSHIIVTQCINTISEQQPNGPETSKMRGLKVLLEIERQYFKVLEAQTLVVRQTHPLYSIRVWGIGRENNSKHFAYVTRDPIIKKHICRVFQCDGLARDVACMLRDICNNLAEQKKGKTISNSENKKPCSPATIRSQNVVQMENVLPAQNGKGTLKTSTTSTEKPVSSGVVITPEVWHIGCQYLGMVQVSNPAGKDVLNNAIDLIFSNISKELWLQSIAEISLTSVRIMYRETPRVNCPVKSITFVGMSNKNEKLGAFIMSRGNNENCVHVVSFESSSQNWFDTMKTVCKLDSTKFEDHTTKQHAKGSKSKGKKSK